MAQEFTDREKAKEAEREVGLRRRVYKGWVEIGRMTQKESDRRIAIMEAIAADYRERAESEEQKGRLL